MSLEVPNLVTPVDDSVQQPTPAPLATAIRDSFDDERTDFVNSLKTVANIAPAEYGKANATARMSGIPAATLYQQRERMDELEKGNKYAAIYDSSRKTANALRDGNLAAVAQNDLDALTRIEGAASDTRFNQQSLGEKMLGAIQQQWTATAQSTNLADAGNLQQIGDSFDAVDAEIARATQAGTQPFLEGSEPGGFAGEYLRSTPEQRQVMRDNLNSQQGEFVSRVGEQQTELSAMPVEPAARQIQQLQTSDKIGIPLGGLERQVIDTGEGMTSLDATLAALTPGFAARTALGAATSSAPALLAGAVGGIPLASAINFGTEFDVKLADVIRESGVDFNDPAALMKALQDDELMQTASDKAVLKAAGTTAVDALGMMFAGRLLAPTRAFGRPLTSTQRELGNLAVQFPVQGISEAAGEAAGQFAAEGKVDAGEVLLEGIAGGLGSSADVLAFGGGRAFSTMAAGLEKSRQARVGQQSLSAAASASVDSETRKLDPGTFQQIATQQLAGTPLETLWIPAEELQRLNQSGAIDLPAILAQVPGLTEQFGDALVRGGNVAMKGADYLTYLADYDAQLSKSVRTSAGGFSVDDSQTWNDQQEEQLTQLAEEFRKGPDPRAAAEQDFVGQLVQAGFRRADAEQYAALHLNTLTNLADRNQLGIDQLNEQFPLDIRNKAPADLRRVTVDDATLAIQRLRTGDIPQAGDIFGKSLGQYLRDAGGVNDAGGELAALDADVGKVGRNRLTRKDSGMSMDEAAMNAWERGYFPGVAREDVTPQLIVDAVQSEMAGNPVYSAEQENPNKADTADTLNQLQEYFDRLGVNLAELSDEEALAILRNPQTAEAGDVQQLNQSGIERSDQLDESVSDEARDLIEELLDNGATVSADGTVRVYHRSTDAGAKAIRSTGKMKGAEDGLFFSTKQDGEATGFGDNLLTFDIPADQLLLDDAFGDEAHVRIPTDKRGQLVDVSKWLDQPQRLNQSKSGETRQQIEARLIEANPGMKLNLMGNGDTVTLSRIELPAEGREKGAGTKVMQELTAWADANGKKLALTPSADFGGNKKRLGEFYKRFGFVDNKGKNKDYEVSESMVRDPRLNQGGNDDDARGFITFSPRGQTNRKFNITLGEKRDLSTLVHELGHYYLEVIQDLASSENAPQQVKDDVQAIREWVGAEGNAPLTTEQHEQFARGFEAYLAEGKAPAPELNGAFARFKRWMMAIYKHLSRLNVALNDDVRKVFDRLVASDEQIQDAERINDALPLFKDAEAAGMTEREFAQYQNSVELAHADARNSVEEQITREETRRQSKWWNEQLDAIRTEVSEEVDLQPEYLARNALRSGQNPDGSAGTFKLSSAELSDRYGKAATQKLAFMHSKDGISLDMAANILGFESGDDLVKTMLGAQPRKAVIEAEALRRMEERHGPKQTGEIAERAIGAVHNERRAEVLGKELRRLAQVGNRRNVTSQQILKEAAARVMSERKVRDIQPVEYQRAEAKASRQSFEAFTRGDLEAAYEAKQRQLLNFYLYREASKAKAEVETITERLNTYNKASKRQKIGKAGGDYLDQIDAVMEQYEFRNVSLRKLDEIKTFGQWYNDQVAAGNDPYVPEFVLNTLGRTNYKELSLSQLQELDDFVAHLNHLASLKGKLQANHRVKDQKEAQIELIRALETNLPKGKPLPLNDSSRTLPQAMGDWLSEANSSLMKLEQIIEQADGGDPNGAWSQIWWQPLAEAQARRDDLNREITDKLMKATDAWFAEVGARAGQKVHINNLGKAIDANGILAVALNSGNTSNLKKMLDGNGWTDAAHAEILSHMTEGDWRYVTNLWEIVNSLWPDIVALEKQVNGIAPEKIEGIPINTPFGVVQGAYWPLFYDYLSDEYAAILGNLGQLAPLNEQGGVRATTSRGHTKARADGFAAPVVLDVTVIANHLSGVIHDLTHRVAIADARKLITAPTVRQVMNERMGRFQAQQFINILDGITNDLSPGSAKGVGIFRRTMNTLRSNASIAWMGYSVTTMFNQFGGASQALEYFAQKGQRKHYLRALAKFSMNPLKTRAEVMNLSGEMRNRSINLDPSIRQATNRLIRVGEGRIGTALNNIKNGHDAIRRWAFVPMSMMQSVVDTPVWMGAYEAEGGVNSGNGGQDAIAAADRAVRLTQMAGGAKDLAPIQHNELAKFFLLVYGYASLLWNRNVDIARSGAQAIREKDAQATLVTLERFVYLNIIPAILAGAIKGALPKGDDDDRDKDKIGDTWPEYIAIQTLLSVTSGVPLARDAAAGFFSDFGYGGASPIGGGIDALIKATNSSKSEALATNMTTAVGMLTGLPSSQINRATRTFYKLDEGEMDADAFTIAKSILFGPPAKKD